MTATYSWLTYPIYGVELSLVLFQHFPASLLAPPAFEVEM